MTADLRRTLLPWRRLSFPIDWSEVFGRRAPLHLEVGFGDGRYTVRRAAQTPDEDFVGVEVSGVSVRRALAKVAREGAGNVRLLKGNAQVALRHAFDHGRLASITVNFPDPWPKARHADHRLLRAPFFRLAADRLEAAGEIRLATDDTDYLAFARAEADGSGLFDREARPMPDDVRETKYARKWREQGKPLHLEAFVRNARPAPPEPLPERPSCMPHALLHGSFPSDAAFEKIVLPYEGGHVILHELAHSLGGDRGPEGEAGRDRWLVRATVDEPDLTQQLLVVVQRREGEELIVRLEPFGDPIVTPAVRGAVHGVTEWLLAAGGLELRARNY